MGIAERLLRSTCLYEIDTPSPAGDAIVVSPSGCRGTVAVYTALHMEVQDNNESSVKDNMLNSNEKLRIE